MHSCYSVAMAQNEFSFFDTRLGRCGIAWRGGAVVAASFADESDSDTRARLFRNGGEAVEVEAPPPFVMRIITDIARLFEGERRDLSYVECDFTGVAEFDQSVLRRTTEIMPGETKTYGDIARALGDVSLSRRVGQALGRNRIPIIIPCHRVIGANGAMTGFSAPGGTVSKMQLLKIEGALEPDLFD